MRLEQKTKENHSGEYTLLQQQRTIQLKNVKEESKGLWCK